MSNGPFTTFQVYGRFGHIISTHVCDHSQETHHRAADEARMACHEYETTTGKDAWVRRL